ncbi:FN3 associated domain-containing protein [Desnuesiella massiliensis]|uniref:RCC1 domain-containing protein n=1 Tax=Desnuesiella massiliensis TaxID=1650662 RepID=UPI0006E38908|nr:FN3 associated domain-containing protein [Desnuesiella massiliensis]
MGKNKINNFKHISLLLSFILIFINLKMVNTKALDYIEVKSDWTLQYDLNVDTITVNNGTFDTNYYTMVTSSFYQKGGASLLRGNNNIVNGTMSISEGQVQIYGNLTINGDLNISGGSLVLNGANIIINGNLNITGGELDLGKGNAYINSTGESYGGNMNFSNGKLDVNGANLNIEGDLIQNGGTFDGINTVGSLLHVNGGNVSVGRNYTLMDFGKLRMENPKDFVLVKGDFFFSTYSQHKDILKDGILEIKGTFQQRNFNTTVNVGGQKLSLTQKNNFMPMLNHKVVLSGIPKQSASFDGDNTCQFNILEVKNNLLTDYYMSNVKWNKLIESARASDNVDLVNITINGQNIKIVDPRATNYDLTLPSNTTDGLLNVLAEPYDRNAAVSIEGNRLVNKAALVKITVTAEDKTTKKTYYVNVQLKDSEIYSMFTDIKTADYHSLVLRNDGVLFGFGANNFGQLGDGTTNIRIKLTQVKNLSNVIDFDTSNSHSIALTSDGSVWVWGLNDYGQLSESIKGDLLNPVKVLGLRDIVKVQAGNRYNLALDRNGFVWMWGYNNSGQFGDEEERYSLKPILVSGFSGTKIKDIAAGDFHCLALSMEGKVYAWGANDYGQIGDGTLNSKYNPIEILGLYGVKSIAAEGNTSSCIKGDGTALFWGESKFYTQGNIKVPESIKDITDIASIKVNSDHMILLKKDGQSFSLGNNNFGQLGDGTYSNRKIFVHLKELSKISKISIGTYNTFALTEEGYIYGLGRNNLGQLGINESGGTYNEPQRLYGFDATSVDRVYANCTPGEIDKYSNIRLYANTSGANIYYTLDGTDPTEKSILYSSPINITEHTIIKAVAIKYGKYSAVSTFEYYISNKPRLEMNVTIDSKSVEAGTSIEIPIIFSNIPVKGVSKLKFAVSYNPEIIELEDIVPGGGLIIDNQDFSYSRISDDTILLNFEDSSKISRNINKNGIFATLKFFVKSGAASGRYAIVRQAYESEGFYNSTNSPINVYYNGGYVDINTFLYGDVDGDGKVTALDLQYVQRYVEKKISYFPWYRGAEAADVDRDGSITSRDVELIKKLILN